MKDLNFVRFNKSQNDTVAKATENLGTLLAGAVLLQEFLGTKPITVWSKVECIIAAIICYAVAIYVRRIET